MHPIEVHISPSVGIRAVTKVVNEMASTLNDTVAVESPLEIRLHYQRNGRRFSRPLVTTMRTPGNDRELAVGFLFSEGIISSFQDVRMTHACRNGDRVRIFLSDEVQFHPSARRRFLSNSSCGVCGVTSVEQLGSVSCLRTDDGPRIRVETILSLPEQLKHAQVAFQQTGGLHAAALVSGDGQLLSVREDVGRHNALDKLIGSQLALKSIPASNFILLMSSRASYELIQKASRAGITILAAVGAPTTLAIDLANRLNLTLIGFVRDDRFNIYTHSHRIEGV